MPAREIIVGAQSPILRVPLADRTLVATKDKPSDELIPDFLAASDVLGTGWFAAEVANVRPGSTVVVVGDGAVGLLGVLSSRQMGAERIIATSRHDRYRHALETVIENNRPDCRRMISPPPGRRPEEARADRNACAEISGKEIAAYFADRGSAFGAAHDERISNLGHRRPIFQFGRKFNERVDQR